MHWGAEEQGRQTRTSCEQRQCQHCQRLDGPGGIEDVRHILFVCPLYREERLRWPELFTGFQRPAKEASLNAFFQQDPKALAAFAAACRSKAAPGWRR
jgi:hypothetical protein